MVTHYTPGRKYRVDADPIAPRTTGSVSFLQKTQPFVLGAILLMVGLGVVAFVGVPDTLQALENAAPYQNLHSDVYEWNSPFLDEEEQTMILTISEEEYEASFNDNRVRRPTMMLPPGTNMLDPEDKYVIQIADKIAELTEGMDDRVKANVALNFVQTAIEYETDDDLFGMSEFWATPLETLYLHSGDCEDTSYLLGSIYLVLGIDFVILNYPGHIAIGVCFDGSGKYIHCETTSYKAELIGAEDYWGEAIEYKPDSSEGINELIGFFFGSYRSVIRDFIGI